MRGRGLHAVPPPHRPRHGLPLPRVTPAARSGRRPTSSTAGKVIITEPGIYSPEGGWGVRHEDNAVVTAEGAVVLATTEYPFDLS